MRIIIIVKKYHGRILACWRYTAIIQKLNMKKLLATLLLIAFLLPTPALATEKLFYFFDNEYGFSSFKSNYKNIDIVAPQIYEVGSNLKVSNMTEKKLVKYAKKKKVSVMPLLVNAHFDKVLMSTILITPKAQDNIISFMIKEAKKQKYIGWQFDFENINHLDRDLYTAFVKKTYEALKKENLQFSVAVVVRTNDYDKNDKEQDWSGAYDYAELAKNSDFLTLMTYDEPYSIGPVASVPYVKKVLDYMLTKAPPEKLSLGIPLYCWKWQGGVRAGSTTYRLAEKAYKKGKKKMRHFDDVYGAEFFRFMTGDLQTVIWCENEKSLGIKMGLIEDNGLRGFSAWALGQDNRDMWRVLSRD